MSIGLNWKTKPFCANLTKIPKMWVLQNIHLFREINRKVHLLSYNKLYTNYYFIKSELTSLIFLLSSLNIWSLVDISRTIPGRWANPTGRAVIPITMVTVAWLWWVLGGLKENRFLQLFTEYTRMATVHQGKLNYKSITCKLVSHFRN